MNVVLNESNKKEENSFEADKKEEFKCYGDKIIIMIQKKILKFIDIIGKKKFIENYDNKLEYTLSLLNTSYTLRQSQDKDLELIIKKQNNQIIEGFIKISSGLFA